MHTHTKFKTFLLQDRSNRALLWIAAVSIIIQFAIFKICYPYAGFINGDSYSYLREAYLNTDISVYPIGYSKFLRLFNTFTKSDTVLVAFQYLSIQASAIWLIFTLYYFYSPGKWIKRLIFALALFNPAYLYMSNYVSSDSLFLALSVTWFTSLLWMLKDPTRKLIVLQAIVLFLAFTIRYNALYYPFVTATAILLSHQSWQNKIIGIGLSIFLVGCFILVTSSKFYQLTGVRQFTPFSGWQLANNALYAYRYVDNKDVKKVPPEFQSLDRLVRNHFDTTRDWVKHFDEGKLAGTMYMWEPGTPLVTYMREQFSHDSNFDHFLYQWASMAPLYSKYGKFLILTYPNSFIKFYLLPNLAKYYAPPLEFLNRYNMGRDTVAPIAQIWFGYSSKYVKCKFKDFEINILNFIPILSGILNVVFLFCTISIFFLGGSFKNKTAKLSSILSLVFWVSNISFSVFSSAVTLRYQLFGILIISSFALITLDMLYKVAFTKKTCAQAMALT